jgi:hypothetical protein
METPVELAKYGSTGVAVLAVFCMAYMVRLFLNQMNKTARMRDNQDKQFIRAIENNTKCSAKLESAVVKSTSVTEETVAYLKHRNGSFEKLIKEQPYIHQLVKEHFDGNNKTEDM